MEVQMKRLALCFLMLLLLCSCSAASTLNTEDCFLGDRVRINAGMLGKPDGTLLPVYSAPSEEAYRGANGKASVSLREPFYAWASSIDGNWLLIEYTVSDTENRIGWIRIGNEEMPTQKRISEWEDLRDPDDMGEPVRKGTWDMPQQIGTADLMVTTDTVDLTDDPNGGCRTLRKLKSGETVGGMCSFSSLDGRDWVYVRTIVDGKKAFGFVPMDAVRNCPSSHVEKDVLVIEDGIEFLGLEQDLLDGGGIYYLDGGPVRSVIETGMIQGFIVDEVEQYGETFVRSIQLPDSLRVVGDDAFYCFALDELVIPEGVRYIRGLCPFMAMQIGTLYLPSTLEDFRFGMRFTNVGMYVLSEKNPRMTCVDGVIYSKDRKILLSYPNGKDAETFDVPKGTEEIAEYAFYAGPYYDAYYLNPVPLRALSLPLGLKKIGTCAFGGLDELISLTIPPTVEELAGDAFGEMVSLQFLNMPDRLKNEFYWYWHDKRMSGNGFEGDNGERMGNSIW